MKVFHVLLLLFIAVPLVEIYLLLEVGGVIGAVPTIGLVVLTAVAGAALVRAQGFSTILQVRRSMEAGEIPAVAIIEGNPPARGRSTSVDSRFSDRCDRFWLPDSSAAASADSAVHRNEDRPLAPVNDTATPGTCNRRRVQARGLSTGGTDQSPAIHPCTDDHARQEARSARSGAGEPRRGGACVALPVNL